MIRELERSRAKLGALRFVLSPQWTENTVVSLTVPSVAPIVVVPVPVVKAAPDLSMTATGKSDELHATCSIRFSVVPSLNVPVATNCCGDPKATSGLEGLIAMELNVAFVTVSGAIPTNPGNAAVTVAVPGAFPAAAPKEKPKASLIVVTDGFDEVQNTELVSFWVVIPANVPVAFKTMNVPCATPVLVNEIVIAVRGSTVRLAVLFTAPNWQVIVTGPFDTPVTLP